MAINIAVIGKSIRNKKFDNLWEILEEAKEEGEISFDTYMLETHKGVIDKSQYNGIIYIATAPSYEIPAVYLPLQASNEQIVDALKDLSNKMKKQLNKEDKKISVITEIEGKEVKLNQDEVIQLGVLRDIMDKFGYSIIQTIVE